MMEGDTMKRFLGLEKRELGEFLLRRRNTQFDLKNGAFQSKAYNLPAFVRIFYLKNLFERV